MSSRLVRFGFDLVTKLIEMFGLASLGKRLRSWFVSEQEAFWSQITNSLDNLIASGSGDVFIDLGAHTGEQAIPASFHLPVIAFEPDPIAARNLRQRMSSLTEAQQITVYEVAASDKSEHSCHQCDLPFHEPQPGPHSGFRRLQTQARAAAQPRSLIRQPR